VNIVVGQKNPEALPGSTADFRANVSASAKDSKTVAIRKFPESFTTLAMEGRFANYEQLRTHGLEQWLAALHTR